MKSIDVIVYTDKNGNIRPQRLRLKENDKYIILEIKRLLHVNKSANKNSYICEIENNSYLKKIELEYYKYEGIWYLK